MSDAYELKSFPGGRYVLTSIRDVIVDIGGQHFASMPARNNITFMARGEVTVRESVERLKEIWVAPMPWDLQDDESGGDEGPTPGPWVGNSDDNALEEETTKIVGANGKVVLEIGYGGFACESDPYGAYPILEASDEDWALIKAAPEMLAKIQRLEWSACIGTDWQELSGAILGCEFCQMEKADGHTPGCELGNLLKRLSGCCVGDKDETFKSSPDEYDAPSNHSDFNGIGPQ
jgi:hypothetical protein